MATKRPPESFGSTSNKKAKPSVPAIPWSKNGNRLKWALLTEAEKPENIVCSSHRPEEGSGTRFLCFSISCTHSTRQNTSGDRLTTVFHRIAANIVPTVYEIDKCVAADRTKVQWGE